MERRLAAILAADVQGYSHHTERNEEASTAALRLYRTVVEEAISAHKGHIFSSAGDGVVAEFPSIVEAIRCAIEIQNEIAERNESVPESQQMQFRIGVNLGDVIAEGDSLYGTGVNVAARLEQFAEPGGICVSQTVYDQVRKIIVAVGSFYLRQPVALWDAVLGDSVGFPEHPAIIVLPFDDMSPTHDQQYLADGITEDLITGLAKSPELLVMARTASFAYKDKPTDIRQVKKDLGVHYIVDGSIQRSDRDLRVTAQLIDVATGSELWAESYDRQIESIFAIRDDIARSIAGTLGGLSGKLAKAEVARLSGKNPNSFTAYDYLMRGWYEWHKFTPESNAVSRELFEQARKIDPEYARAYVGLCWAYANDFDYEWTSDYAKTLKLTLDMASTAVRLDPNDYQAHWALAWAYLYHRQHDKGVAEYARARELNPNDAELIAEMANFLIFMVDPKQAIEHAKEGIRLNPFHENWYDEYLGWAYAEAGMPKEAIEVFQKAIDLENPADDQLWYFPTIAAAYADPAVGQPDDARKIVKTLLSRKPGYSISDSVSRSFPYKTKELVDRYVNAARSVGLPD